LAFGHCKPGLLLCALIRDLSALVFGFRESSLLLRALVRNLSTLAFGHCDSRLFLYALAFGFCDSGLLLRALVRGPSELVHGLSDLASLVGQLASPRTSSQALKSAKKRRMSSWVGLCSRTRKDRRMKAASQGSPPILNCPCEFQA
jgi:hypothetical protein